MTHDEYPSTIAFTNEWYDLHEVVNSARFADWMEMSDQNCGTNVTPHVKRLIEAVNAIENEFEQC